MTVRYGTRAKRYRHWDAEATCWAMSTLKGVHDPSDRRYFKFKWNDAGQLPEVGKTDHFPKGGAFHWFCHGQFESIDPKIQMDFDFRKQSRKLSGLGSCVYCGSQNRTPLTSEHIIPEFLNAGVEVPAASCFECQKVTSKFESKIARDMFDPLRKWLNWPGKNGLIKKSNFNLDLCSEISDFKKISVTDFPVVICLPNLYPATEYSQKPARTDGLFNIIVHNINAERNRLQSIGIDSHCTCHIDMVYFNQMIAKIGYVYASIHNHGAGKFTQISKFIREDIPNRTIYVDHFRFVGCIANGESNKCDTLHELELGVIRWNSRVIPTSRVRLFAGYGFPSYYVAIV